MQEQDEKTAKPLTTTSAVKEASGGILVRPNEKVKVVFINSKFHKENVVEEIHPALAAKFLASGAIKLHADATDVDKKRVAEFKQPAQEKTGKKEKDV